MLRFISSLTLIMLMLQGVGRSDALKIIGRNYGPNFYATAFANHFEIHVSCNSEAFPCLAAPPTDQYLRRGTLIKQFYKDGWQYEYFTFDIPTAEVENLILPCYTIGRVYEYRYNIIAVGPQR